MSDTLFELQGVTKDFQAQGKPLRILNGIDLTLRRGETLAITGPSGSGKSTLLGLMAGLERPTAGQLLFEGESMRDWSEDRLSAWRRGSVGFIFQNFRLVPSLTASENIRLPLEIKGEPAGEAREKAAEALAHLGLSARRDHFPHQLSGGEQQRVAIARAYAHDPVLIFADEPTGSVDRETAVTVLDCLLAARGERRTALVLVTHDRDVAAAMSRTLTLERGVLS